MREFLLAQSGEHGAEVMVSSGQHVRSGIGKKPKRLSHSGSCGLGLTPEPCQSPQCGKLWILVPCSNWTPCREGQYAVSWGPSLGVTKTYSYFCKLRFELISGFHPTPAARVVHERLPTTLGSETVAPAWLDSALTSRPGTLGAPLLCADIRTEPRARRSDSGEKHSRAPTQRQSRWYLSRLA